MGAYRKKLCWDSENGISKTRILITVERRESRIVVKREGKKWSKGPSFWPILDFNPQEIPSFVNEADAIAFADQVVNGYINGEQFRECPDEQDEEF